MDVATENMKYSCKELMSFFKFQIKKAIPNDEKSIVNELPLEEICQFTHYVKSGTYGGELVARIRITNYIPFDDGESR